LDPLVSPRISPDGWEPLQLTKASAYDEFIFPGDYDFPGDYEVADFADRMSSSSAKGVRLDGDYERSFTADPFRKNKSKREIETRGLGSSRAVKQIVDPELVPTEHELTTFFRQRSVTL
jgi:hypothetical protein